MRLVFLRNRSDLNSFMKLTFSQLTTHLQGSLSHFYIIMGNEPLLIQEAAMAIRKVAQHAGFTDRQWLSPTHQEDWQQVGGLYSNLDLFSQRQVIEIHIPNGKPSQHGIQHLLRYAEHPIEDHIVIISTEKIDKSLLSSKWVTQCESSGVLLPIWPLSPSEVSAWLKQRSEYYSVNLERPAFTELLTRTQGNLVAAEHALQQLSLISQPITLSKLQEFVADQAIYAVSDFVQHLLQRNHSKSLHVLNRLQQHDVEPTWIIWQLAQALRTVHKAAAKALLPLLSQVEAMIKGNDGLDNWLALKNFTYEAIKS
jgi:DNA polymerase III subunit delta